MSKTDLLERYEALPLPTTQDEHWRFTDLRGFDPESFTANGATSVERASGMLDVDAAAIAHVSEGGIEIERAPEGITFERLEDDKLLGTLVGADEKFAAHNAAEWKHGLLVRGPRLRVTAPGRVEPLDPGWHEPKFPDPLSAVGEAQPAEPAVQLGVVARRVELFGGLPSGSAYATL